MNQLRFDRIAWSYQRYKKAVFCRNQHIHKFGDGKMYAAALHKILTQTVDSSHVLTKCIRQNEPKINKSITKKLDKNN